MSTPVSDISNVTNIVLSFPDWVYFVLTSGIIVIAFVTGVFYAKLHNVIQDLRKVVKEQTKIIASLAMISEILLQKKLTKTPIYVASSSPVKLTKAGNAACLE